MECEGARKRSKTWLRGSPRRAAREPEVNHGGQNATKIGVSRGLEKCRKKCRFAVLAGRSYPKTGENGVFRFASGSLAALRFARFSGFWRSGRRTKIAKTLRFCGFRVWWRFLGRPVFVNKTGVRKSAKKVCVPKNGAQLIFWRPISDHFWRTVSEGGFSCGAERVFRPL